MLVSNSKLPEDAPNLVGRCGLSGNRVVLVNDIASPVKIGRARNMSMVVFRSRSGILRRLDAFRERARSDRASHIDDANRGIRAGDHCRQGLRFDQMLPATIRGPRYHLKTFRQWLLNNPSYFVVTDGPETRTQLCNNLGGDISGKLAGLVERQVMRQSI